MTESKVQAQVAEVWVASNGDGQLEMFGMSTRLCVRQTEPVEVPLVPDTKPENLGHDMRNQPVVPLRMKIVWDVLERANDAGDEVVIGACRRVIEANLKGWQKHRAFVVDDFRLVMAFAFAP
jgi:hypothetical protein